MGGVTASIISIVFTICLLLYTRTSHYDKFIDKIAKKRALKIFEEEKKTRGKLSLEEYLNERVYDFRDKLNEQIDEINKGDKK